MKSLQLVHWATSIVLLVTLLPATARAQQPPVPPNESLQRLER